MILKVISNLNDSTILWFYGRGISIWPENANHNMICLI